MSFYRLFGLIKSVSVGFCKSRWKKAAGEEESKFAAARKFPRSLVTERVVRAPLVMLQAPTLHDDVCVGHRAEEPAVEALVAQLSWKLSI